MLSLDVPYEAITLVSIIFLVLACVSVATRIWVKLRLLSNGLQADDWTILLALFCFIIFCILAIILAIVEERNPVFIGNAPSQVLNLLLAGELTFMVTTIFFKISLTIFFRRFLLEVWQQKFILVVAFIYCSASTVGVGLALFQCGTPMNLAEKYQHGRCMPSKAWDAVLYLHGILATGSDWIYALLPIFALYKSQLSRAAKISASTLLMLACIGSIAALGRLIFTHKIRIRPEQFDPSYRPTYYETSATMIVLSIVESGLGITAVSLACCRPIVREIGDAFGPRLTRLYVSTVGTAPSTLVAANATATPQRDRNSGAIPLVIHEKPEIGVLVRVLDAV